LRSTADRLDHEIFRLRDDVIAHEGPETTFYSFVGVSRKATMDEINKAYRRQAARMHPDKARQRFIAKYEKDTDKNKKKPTEREISAFHKEASARFSRLGVVAGILRGSQRDRYDFFLDHGFPKWRGTGYYYQRYRPGAGTVLFGLFIVGGGFAHYGAMILSYNRQRAFAEKYIKSARKSAWGDSMVIPGLDTASATTSANGSNDTNGNSALNRRQKRLQEKEDKKKAKKGISTDDIGPPQDAALISGPQGTKKRVTAENGKTLIVDSVGNVFVEEVTESGEVKEFFIDVSESEAANHANVQGQRNSKTSLQRYCTCSVAHLDLVQNWRQTAWPAGRCSKSRRFGSR
jgi:hypothetical protein